MRNPLSDKVIDIKPSGIRKFFDLVVEMNDPNVISLGVGEPDFDTPSSVIDTACTSLHHGETHYIANNGDRQLLEKISAFEREHNGLFYSADEIIVLQVLRKDCLSVCLEFSIREMKSSSRLLLLDCMSRLF